MSESLGRWLSAPLVYVLAEVRCSPTLDIAKRAAAVQELLRDQFPLVEPVTEVQAGPAGTSASIMYSFTDNLKQSGVIVTGTSLCYHATKYITSNEFFQGLGWVLKQLEPIYARDSVLRLGLRYVDAIVPQEGKSVFDYVSPEMAGIPGDDQRRVQCVVELPRQNGGVAVRFLAVGMPLMLSPDLLAIGLKRPEWAEKALSSGKASAILDTDNWNAEQRAFVARELLSTFVNLKAGITDAFLRVTSEHAQNEWREPRAD